VKTPVVFCDPESTLLTVNFTGASAEEVVALIWELARMCTARAGMVAKRQPIMSGALRDLSAALTGALDAGE